MAPLSPLFQGMQAGAFVIAALLLGGIFYGMFLHVNGSSPRIRSRWSGPSAQEPSDKRRASRMPCNLFLELLEEGKVAGTGRLVNLSTSGACFMSNFPFQSGDFFLARLPNLRKGFNKISGQVIWSRATPSTRVYGIRLNRETRV